MEQRKARRFMLRKLMAEVSRLLSRSPLALQHLVFFFTSLPSPMAEEVQRAARKFRAINKPEENASKKIGSEREEVSKGDSKRQREKS